MFYKLNIFSDKRLIEFLIIDGYFQQKNISYDINLKRNLSVFFLSVYLSVCVYVWLFAAIFICLSVCWFICPSVYWSVYPSVHILVCLSVFLFFFHLLVCLFIFPSVCPSVNLLCPIFLSLLYEKTSCHK